jgi:hypothetical protein
MVAGAIRGENECTTNIVACGPTELSTGLRNGSVIGGRDQVEKIVGVTQEITNPRQNRKRASRSADADYLDA